jgi:hypothetical protein
VTIDEFLTWAEHIDNVIKKLAIGLVVAEFAGFVQRIFLHGWFNTHFSFYKVYFTQILNVNYNNLVLHFTTSNHSN